MKKTLTTIAILLFLISKANASNYVGIELQSNSLDYNDNSIEGIDIKANDYYDDSSSNLSFYYGRRLQNDLAIEFGYSQISTDKTNNATGIFDVNTNEELTSSTSADYNILDFDLLKSYNLDNNFGFFFLGGAKLIRAEYEERFNILDNNTKTKFGYGLNGGLGFTFNVSENLTARLKAKYSLIEGLDSDSLYGNDGLDNILTFSTGVDYSF